MINQKTSPTLYKPALYLHICIKDISFTLNTPYSSFTLTTPQFTLIHTSILNETHPICNKHKPCPKLSTCGDSEPIKGKYSAGYLFMIQGKTYM